MKNGGCSADVVDLEFEDDFELDAAHPQTKKKKRSAKVLISCNGFYEGARSIENGGKYTGAIYRHKHLIYRRILPGNR